MTGVPVKRLLMDAVWHGVEMAAQSQVPVRHQPDDDSAVEAPAATRVPPLRVHALPAPGGMLLSERQSGGMLSSQLQGRAGGAELPQEPPMLSQVR